MAAEVERLYKIDHLSPALVHGLVATVTMWAWSQLAQSKVQISKPVGP
jgi:hypothetical protein